MDELRLGVVSNRRDMTITLHQGDLPDGLDLGQTVAVDSETMGLQPARDRLCLVQLSAGDGAAHLVQLAMGDFAAPNLRRLLADRSRLKLFHYARFDLGVLRRYLDVECGPIYCTKVASRLARTYTDRHGLKDLVRELLGVELDKTEQSSDWGAAELSETQMRYAAKDVLYLHALRTRLDAMLAREGRTALAQACFGFLPSRVALDLAGWPDQDVFAH
jgi:ribonuclease D